MKANITISAETAEEESEIVKIISNGLAARGIAVSYVITNGGVFASEEFIGQFKRDENIVKPSDPVATVNVYH